MPNLKQHSYLNKSNEEIRREVSKQRRRSEMTVEMKKNRRTELRLMNGSISLENAIGYKGEEYPGRSFNDRSCWDEIPF